MTKPSLPANFPDALREPLGQLATSLTEVLGGQFKSLILYGGLARGEYIPGRSDVNLLLIVGDASVELLATIRGPLQAAQAFFEAAVMVLTPADLNRAADCFPTKFLDIQRCHLVLGGENILGTVVIPRDRLLRQCMRELQNLLMRLRHHFLDRAGLPERLERTIRESLPALMTNIATLLELQLGKRFETRSEVVPAAEKHLGFGANELAGLLALKHGELHPGPEEVRRLYQVLMNAATRAVEKAEEIS